MIKQVIIYSPTHWWSISYSNYKNWVELNYNFNITRYLFSRHLYLKKYIIYTFDYLLIIFNIFLKFKIIKNIKNKSFKSFDLFITLYGLLLKFILSKHDPISIISSSKEVINPYKCGSLSISKLGEKYGPSLFKLYTTKNNAVDPFTHFMPSSIYLRLYEY